MTIYNVYPCLDTSVPVVGVEVVVQAGGHGAGLGPAHHIHQVAGAAVLPRVPAPRPGDGAAQQQPQHRVQHPDHQLQQPQQGVAEQLVHLATTAPH